MKAFVIRKPRSGELIARNEQSVDNGINYGDSHQDRKQAEVKAQASSHRLAPSDSSPSPFPNKTDSEAEGCVRAVLWQRKRVSIKRLDLMRAWSSHCYYCWIIQAALDLFTSVILGKTNVPGRKTSVVLLITIKNVCGVIKDYRISIEFSVRISSYGLIYFCD